MASEEENQILLSALHNTLHPPRLRHCNKECQDQQQAVTSGLSILRIQTVNIPSTHRLECVVTLHTFMKSASIQVKMMVLLWIKI